MGKLKKKCHKLTTGYCKVTGTGVIYKGIHESEWVPSI